MKVVLFCGGHGTRLQAYSDTIPKPLVNIGVRPIIWHLMRYYAHHGHKDFVLALGYWGDLSLLRWPRPTQSVPVARGRDHVLNLSGRWKSPSVEEPNWAGW